MCYINIKQNNIVTTLDSFDTYKETRIMLMEYRIASNYYNAAYISTRATKGYRDA